MKKSPKQILKEMDELKEKRPLTFEEFEISLKAAIDWETECIKEVAYWRKKVAQEKLKQKKSKQKSAEGQR